MAGEQKTNIKPWTRPWNMEKFDDLFNRDERFFGVLLKGVLSWFNTNIVMYNKPINHFIFTTGSSYMYIESNGYDFKWNETTGEDWMYMQLPRCTVEMNSLRIPTEELSSPFARGTYERVNGNEIKSFNAQIRRLPIELDLTFRYYFSNFNECVVFLQEAMDKLLFQKFFRIAYLGQTIRCSIEMPQDFNIQINPIDMTSTDPKQRTIELAVKINSNYPLIDEATEIPANTSIQSFTNGINPNDWTKTHPATVWDENGNKIEVHYLAKDEAEKLDDESMKPGTLVDSELNKINAVYDEFGNRLTSKDLAKLFNTPSSAINSGIFNGTLNNTHDVLNKD